MNIDAQKLIEKGIKYNDMDLVAEGYALLAAQEDDNKSLMIPTREGTESTNQNPDNVSEERPEPPRGSGKDDFSFQIRNTQGAKRERPEGGTYMRVEELDTNRISAFNMFVDDLEEDKEDTKEEIAKRNEGKTLYVKKPVRRKPPAKTVEVTCVDCNRNFKVPPMYAPKIEGGRSYVCNKCIMEKAKKHRM